MNFISRFGGKLATVAVTIISLLFNRALSQPLQLWENADASSVYSLPRYSTPESFRTLTLDILAMRNELLQAPMEFTEQAKSSITQITIPLPDGSNSTVSVQETQVMSPGLAAHYPKIKTYTLRGISDPRAYGRIDVTNFGFHAMILSPRGDVFIDPASNDNDQLYICYYKKDLPREHSFECLTEHSAGDLTPEYNHAPTTAHRSSGDQLRTYRLALACTGEYAATKGGTVSGALSGMVTSINRVDGIYEEELSVRMQLIDNDTLLIYTNAATDPYTNSDPNSLLTQNQNNIDSVIGNANYDFGHVFTTGGGGLSSLGIVCRTNQKAQSETGLPNPVGDAFDVDYVAHEMGHEFSANHPFNATTGSCCCGNRWGPTAFEPGSASTIMGYAGICTTNDLQAHSDPFFHSGNLDEIWDYTTLDFGADCPVTTETGNNPPVVTAGTDYSIPISTPFRLDASATDADGDSLAYMWDEMDKGPAGNWNSPSGQAPCFRSLAEDTLPYRYFPKLQTIINNYPASAIGEVLPDYARSLNFRFVARDHHPGGGGVTYGDNEVKLTVINTGAPFKVTFPNTLINWPINTQELVTWDVSSTDVAPINCSNVNVLLSIDGGYTYPTTLAAAVPNNGAALVNMPNDASLIGVTKARIMVQSVGNVFFDISNANFNITDNVGVSTIADISSQVNIFPNPTENNLNISVVGLLNETLRLGVYDATGRILFSAANSNVSGEKTFSVEMKDAAGGIYFIEVNTDKGQSIQKIIKQ